MLNNVRGVMEDDNKKNVKYRFLIDFILGISAFLFVAKENLYLFFFTLFIYALHRLWFHYGPKEIPKNSWVEFVNIFAHLAWLYYLLVMSLLIVKSNSSQGSYVLGLLGVNMSWLSVMRVLFIIFFLIFILFFKVPFFRNWISKKYDK